MEGEGYDCRSHMGFDRCCVRGRHDVQSGWHLDGQFERACSERVAIEVGERERK